MDLFVSEIKFKDKYCDIERLYDNVFFAKKNLEGDGIIIDSKGKQIVPGSYRDVVSTYKGEEFVVTMNRGYVVINKFGEQVLPGYYDSIIIYDKGLYLVNSDNLYSTEYILINREGKIVSKDILLNGYAKSRFTYSELTRKKLIEGSKDAYSYNSCSYRDEYVIMNQDGEQIVPGTYREIISADDDLFSVLTLDKPYGMYETYKIIDRDGAEIKLDPKNHEVLLLGGRLFAVKAEWPYYKVVDINNKRVFPKNYAKFKRLDGVLFGVCDERTSDSYDIVNREGNKIIPGHFRMIKCLGENMYAINTERFKFWPFTIIDQEGKRVEGFYGYVQTIEFNGKKIILTGDTKEELREKVIMELQKIKNSLNKTSDKANALIKKENHLS